MSESKHIQDAAMTEHFYVPITNDTPRDHADAVGYVTLETLDTTVIQQPVFWIDMRATTPRVLVHMDGHWLWIKTPVPIRLYKETTAPKAALGGYTGGAQ